MTVKVWPITSKSNRILNRPPSRMRIIIPGAEADQFRVLVVQPTGKSERLESGIRVADYYTILVVVDALEKLLRAKIWGAHPKGS